MTGHARAGALRPDGRQHRARILAVSDAAVCPAVPLGCLRAGIGELAAAGLLCTDSGAFLALPASSVPIKIFESADALAVP